MSKFQGASRETLDVAMTTMREASGMIPEGGDEGVPGLHAATAGVALALERAPLPGRDAHVSKADDWLDPWSDEGGIMRMAVAHVIDGYDDGSVRDASVEGMMRHMVADVANMDASTRQIDALDGRGVEPTGLHEAHAGRVDAARGDAVVAADLRHESTGAYHRVSEGRAQELVGALQEGGGVPASTLAELSRIAVDVVPPRAARSERNLYVQERLGESADGALPLFRDGPGSEVRMDRSRHRVEELALGIGDLPTGEVERGVAAHIAVKGSAVSSNVDRTDARARAHVMADMDLSDLPDTMLAIPDPASRTAAGVAVRIEATAAAMRRADERSFEGFDVDGRDDASMAGGRMSDMTRETQVTSFEAIQRNQGVSALDVVRLQAAVRDLDDADRSRSQDERIEARRSDQERDAARRGVQQRVAERSR